MKLFIWYWSSGYSWEQAVVFAPDIETARELAKEKGFTKTEILKGPPTEIHEKPCCVYDVY